MINDPSAIAYAQRILNERRIRSAEQTEKAVAAAYSKAPGLRELDSRISYLSAQNIMARLKDLPETDISGLEKERAELMEKSGVSESDFLPIHHCPLCDDSGYVGTEQCSCYKTLLTEYEQQSINNVSPLELSSFEDFSRDYYPEKSEDDPNLRPRNNMKRILDICLSYASQFPKEGENLLMIGSSGLGKTHLALSIANRVIDSGYEVFYCSAASIFGVVEDEKFGRRQGSTMSTLKSCDLLVLDDLGAEFLTAAIVADIYDLLNSRINQRKCTVITTNLTDADAFRRRYGEKISSRLLYCSRILPFTGKDIRKIKITQGQ